MKNILLILVAMQVTYAMTQSDLDKKFSDLVKIRETIESEKISKTNDPFYREKIKSENTITFVLQAMVDKRVKINQKWYGLYDSVAAGYKIISIRNEKVGLSNSLNYIELNLKDNKNVKVNVK